MRKQSMFLRSCLKEGLTPKGLRVKLPASVLRSQHGQRLQRRSQKRVVKRTISNLFVKMKALDKQLADLRLSLKTDFGFSTV